MKLGTKLERIFKALGIAWVVKRIWGEDCGCQERKEKLDNFKISRKGTSTTTNYGQNLGGYKATN